MINEPRIVAHLKAAVAQARVKRRKKDPGRKRSGRGGSQAKTKRRGKPKKESKSSTTEAELSVGVPQTARGETEGQCEWLDGRVEYADTLVNAARRVREAQPEWLEEDWAEPAEDYEDNLTYHEDSLSVMKGSISTPIGEEVPVWVTTDSGSMTQLIQGNYVRRLKLKTHPIRDKHCFNIASPGGGKESIDEFVLLKVRLQMKRESTSDQAYGENDSPEEEREVEMKFGVCEGLPVPILWGGAQMRSYDLVDYHSNKTLSMRLGPAGERHITKSVSWLVAVTEMGLLENPKIKKAYRDFLPTADRLAQMVKGERKTINMPAVLYPGRDNVVRVGRHNARVDEGYNEVVVLNREEVNSQYGNWLVVMDSVANGEGFIIVRNNSSHAISLAPGALSIAIRPAVCLPRVMTATDARKSPVVESVEPDCSQEKAVDSAVDPCARAKVLAVKSEHQDFDEVKTGLRSPKTFFTWNCNGLATRMRHQDLESRFYEQIDIYSPDIICLQEVRLVSAEGDPSRVALGSKDEAYWEAFMAPLRGEYEEHLTLCDRKYGGQAVLVKRSLQAPVVSFNLEGVRGHDTSGRFMKLCFPDLIVRSVYAPFNGRGTDLMLKRRQEWDAALRREMAPSPAEEDKGRILLGDFNAVYRDSDISQHPNFWAQQGDQEVEEADRGFGGTTPNERRRFREMLEGSGMADTFTAPSGAQREAKWTFRGEGRFFGKGMKLDYVFADDSMLLSGGVESSRILDNGRDRDDFMGSDHAPLVCTLHSRWRTKRDNLLAHYEAALSRRCGGQENQSEATPLTKDMKWRVDAMILQTAIASRVRTTTAAGEAVDVEVERPAEFPERLWKYVFPAEKKMVKVRYDGFKDQEYLAKCVTSVITELDIQQREGSFNPAWKSVEDEEEWSEESVMRAQALANLDIFFFPNPEEVAMAKDVVAEIETIDSRPFKCRSRKLSVVQQAFLQAKTNIMLRMRQLEEAKSDWCHGLVLVPYEDRINKFMERHGEDAMARLFEPEYEAEVATFFRLCVDLRMLNMKTIPDRFPLPRIDDLLESIPRKCGRYSISDIADAFFKCELLKEHRHKTAFKTHNRHLQFAVLPQGFINSPSVFCRLIAKTFEGVDRRKFSAYIDDVLNHTDDFGEHLAVQQDTYNRLRASQLTLKLSKTHLNYSEVKFLGHILTREGRLPDPKAVEAIQEWKDPTTAKEVRSFLGATLYYREYIYDYSDMAMPLYDLIRKGVVVDKAWDDEIHGKAIQRIKDALTSRPVLMQVDNTKPFRLKVDACRVGRGIGCILEQQNDEGRWQPVSYYSSSLSKEERNYSATELECKALHDCILHYAVYLKYIPHFEVFSDHNALRYMVNTENATTNGRLMRYLLDLQEYNFAIYYRKGTENCDADAVSRLKRNSDQPVYLTEDELSQENGVVSTQMLQRARALDARNKKTEKEARRLLSKLAKDNLREMSILNDHILAEGVENLESESGRSRFFENLKKSGLKCTRETLDDTLEAMREDQGGLAEEQEPADAATLALQCILEETGGLAEEDKARLPELLVNTTAYRPPEKLHYSHAYEKVASVSVLPHLLTNLVDYVAGQIKTEAYDAEDAEECGRSVEANEALDAEELRAKRLRVIERVNESSQETVRDWRVLVTTRRAKGIAKAAQEANVDSGDESESHSGEESGRQVGKKGASSSAESTRKLRRRIRKISYLVEVKTQPNWKRAGVELERDPVNLQLETIRRKGYGKVEVRRSLVLGDSGNGLYAVTKIKEGDAFCTYEGVEVPEAIITQGVVDRDYVASAIRDHKTGEMVYVDAQATTSCYGRFAQDPIDDHLVNAKILWRDKKLRLIASCDIDPGDEIYVEYGLSYWRHKLHFLHKELRARIEKKCTRLCVEFAPEVTVADFKDSVTVKHRDGLRIQSEGEPLQKTPDNLLTRADRYMPEEAAQDEPEVEQEEQLDQDVLDSLSFDNVDECEALGRELNFLNGRKFEDEGRLYEIYQVRYDTRSERVIGFRRPLSGKAHKEDSCPFLVYGLEGLYELSERYLLTHPEDRNDTPWPLDGSGWGALQREDEDLCAIWEDIEDSGGQSIKVGKNKYSLVPAGQAGEAKLLIRVVKDARKGVLEQTMVPKSLIPLTLRIHHDGYAHMGANRMLETIRLRYFWHKMDADIQRHTRKCINCKLRKSYQRRPRVPIMKYDDTSRPLDRVHVDLTGPLPESRAKNKYIMVIKDYLTKYVWLVPLKSKGAVEVAEAFVGEFICQAGIPGRVVSDKGNEFVNRLLTNVSRILDINRISTTPYNPRSDGFVENHNKTLKDQLFHYVDNLKQDDWDVFLPTVQLMYNTTVSLATGFTPMLLMTGREARMPSFSHMTSVDLERHKSVLSNEYVLKMIETMRTYQDFALKQTFKNKERLNVRVRKPLEFVEYEAGQQFMLVRRPMTTFKSAEEKEAWKITMKLLERFEGPYRIIRKLSPVLYDADVDGKEVRVHAGNMKPF